MSNARRLGCERSRTDEGSRAAHAIPNDEAR
jgi:hypothetical protein